MTPNNLSTVLGVVNSTDVKFFATVFLAGTAFFGWYLAFKLRRTPAFSLKLAIMFFIPAILALTYVLPHLKFSPEYFVMISCSFIVLQNILYWKAIRHLINPVSYHRDSIVEYLDSIPDLVWTKDTNHCYTYTSKALQDKLLFASAADAFGHTTGEMLEGRACTEPSFSQICAETDEIALRSPKPQRFHESGVIDGKFISLQVYKAQLKDESGKVVGTIGLGRDMTYDCLDHEEIDELLRTGNIPEAYEAFIRHKDRYKSHCVAS